MSAVVVLQRDELASVVSEAVADALAQLELDAPTGGLLSQDQLAQRLNVSLATIRKLRQKGMPTLWVIESPRFLWDDVLAWLREVNGSADLDGMAKVPRLKSTPANTKPAENPPTETQECNLSTHATQGRRAQ